MKSGDESLEIETTNRRCKQLRIRIPCSKGATFTTCADNQRAVLVAVYEGGRAHVRDTTLVGYLALTDLVPQPKGVDRFEIVLDIASDNLSVLIMDKTTRVDKVVQLFGNPEALIFPALSGEVGLIPAPDPADTPAATTGMVLRCIVKYVSCPRIMMAGFMYGPVQPHPRCLRDPLTSARSIRTYAQPTYLDASSM